MKHLNCTTFNIRCFGFNGNYFATKPFETRLPFLKSFLETHYSHTDVFILQEIMNLELLSYILPDGFQFFSYSHPYPRHMHVVLACRKGLQFSNIQEVPNTALDDTKSRPALYGCLFENDEALAHIIGVHLKSGEKHSDKRLLQCQSLCQFMAQLKPDLPILMGGDFNSHPKDKTKRQTDDITSMQESFKKHLCWIENNKKTYILPNEDAPLDHFWVNSILNPKLSVFDFKNYSVSSTFKNYFDQISDHLPVHVSFDFQ